MTCKKTKRIVYETATTVVRFIFVRDKQRIVTIRSGILIFVKNRYGKGTDTQHVDLIHFAQRDSVPRNNPDIVERVAEQGGDSIVFNERKILS